jgi:hypothetical protein
MLSFFLDASFELITACKIKCFFNCARGHTDRTVVSLCTALHFVDTRVEWQQCVCSMSSTIELSSERALETQRSFQSIDSARTLSSWERGEGTARSFITPRLDSLSLPMPPSPNRRKTKSRAAHAFHRNDSLQDNKVMQGEGLRSLATLPVWLASVGVWSGTTPTCHRYPHTTGVAGYGHAAQREPAGL